MQRVLIQEKDFISTVRCHVSDLHSAEELEKGKWVPHHRLSTCQLASKTSSDDSW